jgi:hypothetical protein
VRKAFARSAIAGRRPTGRPPFDSSQARIVLAWARTFGRCASIARGVPRWASQTTRSGSPATSPERRSKAPLSSSSRDSVSARSRRRRRATTQDGSCHAASLTGTSSASGATGSARLLSSTATPSRMRRLTQSMTCPHLDVHARHDAISGQPEGDELVGTASPRKITRAQARAKPAYSMPTSHLSEKKYGRRSQASYWPSVVPAAPRPRCRAPGPMLDANPLAVEGVMGVGHVAGGEHAGPARAGLGRRAAARRDARQRHPLGHAVGLDARPDRAPGVVDRRRQAGRAPGDRRVSVHRHRLLSRRRQAPPGEPGAPI